MTTDLRITELKIENYKKFKKETIKFPDSDLLLITGNNLDVSGSDSNGSGKSAILSAISYGITGQVIEDKAERLITHGEDKCFVSIKFNNGLIITRSQTDTKKHLYLKQSTKNKVTKLSTSKEIYESATNTEKQDYIYNLLNIDSESTKNAFIDFSNSSYLDPEGINIFTSSEIGNAEKLKFFSKYAGAFVWDDCGEKALSYSSELQKKIDNIDIKINQISNWLDNNETVSTDEGDLTLDEVKDLFNKDTKLQKINLKELETLKAELTIKDSDIKAIQNLKDELIQLNADKNKYKNDLEEWGPIDKHKKPIKDLKDKMGELKLSGQIALKDVPEEYENYLEASVDDVTSEREKLLLQANKIRINIDKLGLNTDTLSCPECNAELLIENQELINFDTNAYNKQQKQINSLLENLADIEYKRSMLLFINNGVLKVHEEYEITKNTLTVKKESLENYNATKKALSNQIYSVKKQIEKIHNSIGELEKITSPEKITEWEKTKQEITNLKEDLEENIRMLAVTEEKIKQRSLYFKDIKNLQSEKDTLLKSNSLYKEWIKLFKSLKSIVLDNSFIILNQLTNQKLKDLEVPFTFKVKSSQKFKTTDNLKFNINIRITDELGTDRNLYEYSKGEKTRIISAMLLALSELKRNNLNLMMFDEYLNELDETGVMSMLKLLSKNKKHNLIVTNSHTLQNNWEGPKLLVTRNNFISTSNFI